VAANTLTRRTFDRAGQLASYDAKVFDLIPLHRWDDAIKGKNGNPKKVGKAPIDNDWTIRPYDSAAVIKRCLDQGRNVGVRLTDRILVVDVDPRNGGEEGFELLCADLGLDPDEWLRVITGSGGWHCYMRLPADVLIVDTLEAYPGVEFKSKGRQVVAAGSKHPDGGLYRWSKVHPNIRAGLPRIPTTLLRAITRPARSAVSSGGQLTQERAAVILAALNVLAFGDNDSWLQLMMAIHHATNGDARQEFIEWSIGDPNFEDDSDWIGRRWDSLHNDKPGGVTYRTLNMILRKHGLGHLQIAEVVQDFDDDDFELSSAEDDTTTGADFWDAGDKRKRKS
jgi:hypothetical protein